MTQAADAERRQGCARCGADLFAWLRAGECCRALTVKNHTIDRWETRAYEWIVDLCLSPDQRRGMGRLDRFE